jgi:hypothetical protein
MKLLRNILIRLHLKEVSQQDVTQAFREKDISALRLFLKTGLYPERAAAAAHLGRLKAYSAVPDLLILLWDDFEPVAKAAQKSLEVFLPDPGIELRLQQARQYWTNRTKQRPRKRAAIYYNADNPRNPMVDRSKMKKLAKLRVQLQNPIRLW